MKTRQGILGGSFKIKLQNATFLILNTFRVALKRTPGSCRISH